MELEKALGTITMTIREILHIGCGHSLQKILQSHHIYRYRQITIEWKRMILLGAILCQKEESVNSCCSQSLNIKNSCRLRDYTS